MSALPPADHRKLVGILGRLGSDHAGERAAAGLLAQEMLTKHNLTWAELLPVASAPTAEAVPPADSRTVKCRPAQWWRDDENDHQRLARVLLQTGFGWSAWEREFLTSACDRKRPSDKERGKLNELRDAFWNRRKAA